MKHTRPHRRLGGFSLIEVMVGIAIALIAVLVIYQVFNVAEGIKRNVTGAGDAQQNGLLSTFGMVLQFSNAGANIAVNGENLDACPYGSGSFDSDVKSIMRPIPVLVADSGDDAVSDKFMVSYGASERVVTPVSFKSAPKVTIGGDGDTYVVQSPLGFKANDVIVLASDGSNGAGTCAWSTVKAVTAPDGDGYVTITHGPTAVLPAGTSDVAGTAKLINLGASPRRIQYDVDANGTLRSTELLHVEDPDNNPVLPFAKVGEPIPIANNVVLMKVQYGIADPTTGLLQKWVKAVDGGSDNWSANTMLTASGYKDLSRIKAIRIAVIVRSESYDRCAYADKCPDPTTTAFNYTLFGECDSVPCPTALTGSIDPTPTKGNFRYRVYETVVPLRNSVWNLQKGT